MLRSAPTLDDGPARRIDARRAVRGRLCGGAALVAIYGITLFASAGLFRAPSTAALGLVNVAALPLLMLVAVAGIRRIWRDGAPNPRLARLILAPLWGSFVLSLLTVPLWMGMANVERQGASAAADYPTTFLLAPWGFMVAYGLALLVICAMYDFTFPITIEAKPQTDTAAIG